MTGYDISINVVPTTGNQAVVEIGETIMLKNNNPENACEAWDIQENEEKFYKGAGRATIIIDNAINIIGCVYHDLDDLPDDDGKKVTGKHVSGMMSCYQFCPDEPIKV